MGGSILFGTRPVNAQNDKIC